MAVAVAVVVVRAEQAEQAEQAVEHLLVFMHTITEPEATLPIANFLQEQPELAVREGQAVPVDKEEQGA
jgi:hypothetical protein